MVQTDNFISFENGLSSTPCVLINVTHKPAYLPVCSLSASGTTTNIPIVMENKTTFRYLATRIKSGTCTAGDGAEWQYQWNGDISVTVHGMDTAALLKKV
jgi:hypothetical protein